jgi:hypothetical protein
MHVFNKYGFFRTLRRNISEPEVALRVRKTNKDCRPTTSAIILNKQGTK